MFIAGSIQSLRWFSYSENNEKKKKSFTNSIYFQFVHGNYVKPAMFICKRQPGLFITGYEFIYTFLPNPYNRQFEINIFTSKCRIFQVIQAHV
jgi:hypothetical protein